MLDFLSFKEFIALDVLIVFYYIGAILAPLLLWKSRNYLVENFKFLKTIESALTNQFSVRLGLLLGFIVMELMWRIMFEMIIAYFQIRDYLHVLAQ